MYAGNKKQALTLSDFLAEFEINRLGRLMFRTFFCTKHRRTDRHREWRHKVFFSEEKKTITKFY